MDRVREILHGARTPAGIIKLMRADTWALGRDMCNQCCPLLPPRQVADHERGIKAIIALQSYVGITETYEEAECAWDAFEEWEKRSILSAAALVLPPDWDKAA